MRVGQLLLVVSAAALWLASRMTWVEVTLFNGLGQPKTVALSGAQWATLLVPLAAASVAAALKSAIGPAWQLRVLAVAVAVLSAMMGYLAISLWVTRDAAAVRAAHLADVPVADLSGTTQLHYTGAVITLFAAIATLAGAVLFLRSPARAASDAGKYSAPARRREAARRQDSESATSERMIWDALDEGRDPTDPDNEGR
jgi:uncharacterized membrane protein (TIGR02234 family)